LQHIADMCVAHPTRASEPALTPMGNTAKENRKTLNRATTVKMVVEVKGCA